MNIQIFKHPDFGNVRTTGNFDEPLFCLVDVCKVLDLRPDHASRQVRDLFESGCIDLPDSDEKEAPKASGSDSINISSADEVPSETVGDTPKDGVYGVRPSDGDSPNDFVATQEDYPHTMGVIASTAMIQIPLKDALGRDRNTNFITEPALYDLIFSSRKPTAKAFKKWVVTEVIPAIRKTGAYIPTANHNFAPNGGKMKLGEKEYDSPYDFLLDLFVNNFQKQVTLMTDHTKIIDTLDTMRSQINKMVRNVDETISREIGKILPSMSLPSQTVEVPDPRTLTDNSAIFRAVCRIQDERGVRYTASALAKWFSMTTATFNKTLKALGVQHRSGGRWHIADNLADRGLTDTATLTIRTASGNLSEQLSLVWTETGKWFLFVLFYRHGYIRTPTQKII